MESPSGWPCITLRHLTHTLDPALKASRARRKDAIRLLINDYKEAGAIFGGNGEDVEFVGLQ